MAALILTDGSEREVTPRDRGCGFTLEELYRLIGCATVQMIELADGRFMWMDEDGKYRTELARNDRATKLLHEAGGLRDDFIVGTVLVTSAGEIQ